MRSHYPRPDDERPPPQPSARAHRATCCPRALRPLPARNNSLLHDACRAIAPCTAVECWLGSTLTARAPGSACSARCAEEVQLAGQAGARVFQPDTRRVSGYYTAQG